MTRNRNREMKFVLDSEKAPAQVAGEVDQALSRATSWTVVKPGEWRFNDLDGSNWKATAEVSSVGNGSFNQIRLAVFKSR